MNERHQAAVAMEVGEENAIAESAAPLPRGMREGPLSLWATLSVEILLVPPRPSLQTLPPPPTTGACTPLLPSLP